MMDEAAEEVFQQFRLQIADEADFDQVLIDQRGAAAEIDRDYGERFIHGEYEITGAVNAFAVAQRLGKQLADYYARIFDCVVLIDVEIALRIDLQVETAMLRK